jgi:EAL and modified HD-GYP domain-containing signal transduction protein
MSYTQLDSTLARRTPGSALHAEPVAHGAAAHFLIRQPLLDSACGIIGYELKIKEHTPVPVLPGAASMQQVRDEALLISVIDMRYQQVLSRKFTLLELDSATLENPIVSQLPKENVILVVAASRPDPELIARCQELARLGYALALDEDHLCQESIPIARECRYLRVDVAGVDLMALSDRLSRLQGLRGARLIARNVETEEAYLACRKLGFELYQGYFFNHPGATTARGIDTGRLRIMNLLNRVIGQADSADIEAEFKLDPGLSYKLLRFINSPAVGMRYPVRSIAHALLMLGHEPLHRWLLLLLFGHESGAGRNRAMLKHALIRARLMETLGESSLDPSQCGSLFVVGILSMLDALLNLPMHDALAPLNLAPPIGDVLLHGRGDYAPYLALAQACETGDSASLAVWAAHLGLAAETVNIAHLSALMWSEGIDM